jgi:hypothetical protein
MLRSTAFLRPNLQHCSHHRRGKKQASPMATQINELLTGRLKLTQRRQTRLNARHGLPANEQRRQRNRKKSQAEERTNDGQKAAKPELAQ